MKTILYITCTLALVSTLNAQSIEKRNLEEPTVIEANAAATITLIQSDSDFVHINSKEEMHFVTTKIQNGVRSINASGGVTCDVGVKNLQAITVHDAATVKSQNTLNVSHLKIKEADGSNINLDVNAGSVTVIAKDASILKLEGNASEFDASSSDGSVIKTSDLKADTVTAIASDGGIIKTWAVNKITARASDGGVITFKGEPAEKRTSTTDGGIIKTDDGTVISSGLDTGKEEDTHDSALAPAGIKHAFFDSYTGFGYVFGPENAGARIKYGRSREFDLGFGYGYKFFKWNGIGADIYYKSTDFFLEPDADKVLPDAAIHGAEKIGLNNFGGLLFDRFFIGKIFFDGGIYYDWIFNSRDVTWDSYSAPNAASATYTKTINRPLTFVNPSDYGLQFRLGAKKGFSFYFNYRMANLFKQTSGIPGLPPYVLGINIGSF